MNATEENLSPQYLLILRDELERRKKRNSRYSLRAFASLLEMHPSALSRVLSGKKELSVQSALDVLRKLKLAPEDQERFVVSVAQSKYRQVLAQMSGASDRVVVAPLDVEEERRAFALKFEKMFEHVPAAVWVTNRTGELIMKNKAAGAVAMPLDNDPSTQVLKDQKPISPQLSHLRRANGNSVPSITSAAPLYDASNELTGAIVIVMEVDPKIFSKN